MTRTTGVGRLLLLAAMTCAAVAAGAGCKSSAARDQTSSAAGAPREQGDVAAGAATSREPNYNTDPCATRLHDLCGAFLLFHAAHRGLPARLEQLTDGAATPLDFTCPTTGAAYTYNPAGLTLPRQPGPLIVYDAAPHPDGIAWAIAVLPPEPNQPLVMKVVAVPREQIPAETTSK